MLRRLGVSAHRLCVALKVESGDHFEQQFPMVTHPCPLAQLERKPLEPRVFCRPALSAALSEPPFCLG